MTNEITQKEFSIIETTTALANPKRDKRSRDWHAQETIPPARFLFDGVSLRMIGAGRFTHVFDQAWKTKEKALFDLIMANAKPATPDTMHEHLLCMDAVGEGDMLLAMLRKRGWITLAQIKEAHADLDAAWTADVELRHVL